MKIIIIISYWLLIILDASARSQSLKNIIDMVNGMEDGKLGYDERMIAAWPGLESESALDEIISELLKPGKIENYADMSHFLEAMRFPNEKIVRLILEKIKDRNTHESGLNRGFGLLQDYTDDPRVFPYLIGFLNDSRPMGRREAMADADYGSVAFRINDCAASVIRHGLRKRGLLRPGDPAWGEPGGASSYANADSALLLLKEFLVKNQLMTVEQSLARPKKEAEMSNSSMNPAPDLKTQVRESKRPEPVIESTKQVSPWMWIWIGIATIGGILGWKFLSRRS